MFDPNPKLLSDAPLQLVDARPLFPSAGPRRRMSGGLARLTSGRLLMTFVLSRMPRRNDGGIMITTSDDDGATWDEPLPIYAAPGWDCYPMAGPRPIGPDHFRLFIGRLKFEPALGGKQPFADWQSTYIDTTDGGQTWTEATPNVQLYPCWTEVYGASNPQRLTDGRLMWAASGTLGRDRDWQFGVSFTDAEGNGFTPPVVIAGGPGLGFPEGDVVRLDDGRLLAVVREQLVGDSVYAHSVDEGQTWSALRPTGFKGANIKLHRLHSGAILCAYRDEDLSRRGVSCSVSEDGGETWRFIGQLYVAPPEAQHVPGHLCGYPDFIETGDRELLGVLHTYEDGDGEITLQVFRLRDLS
ncbi:MAG: sialidase [Thermomicrobiales bacterium]|jgi:hypothetical protein|nr:sialidase [Thermomicrobiales bacterium]